jgi:hypothetical protein
LHWRQTNEKPDSQVYRAHKCTKFRWRQLRFRLSCIGQRSLWYVSTAFFQLSRRAVAQVAEFKASVDVLNAAATKIQGLARGKKGRDRANMQREMERAKRSRDIQGDCGFFGAVHEVLRETVFNLMQECVFGEFDVFGEPVQYFIKDHEQR